MGRRLAYIRLFSFDIAHVPGSKHKGPDSLSWGPATKEEERERMENGRKEEQDIEESIEGALGMMSMSWHEEEVEWQLGAVLRMHVSGGQEVERISRWLLTMERPEGLADAEFARFKRGATKYLIRDGVLYRRSSKGVPPGKVI